jgi:hypothetical protein
MIFSLLIFLAVVVLITVEWCPDFVRKAIMASQRPRCGEPGGETVMTEPTLV